MTGSKTQLKKAILELLDAQGREHPSGHQTSKARRYMLTAPGGVPIEVMFEKDEVTGANIWCPAKVASLLPDLNPEISPKAGLWVKRNKKGELLYGRHSGLRAMPQLAEADLAKFQPRTLGEARRVVDAILTCSASRAVA